VARCPSCRQHFCRECITEHEDQVICSACLRKRVQTPLERRRSFSAAIQTVGFVAGTACAWLSFYGLGRLLLSIPTRFHDGSLLDLMLSVR
jgi:hypothetical protein